MSRIAKLYPTRIYRTQYDPVIENESNMFTGVDSDTYATVTTTTNYSNALFVGGFDISLVPSSAVVSSFSIKMRLASADGIGYQSSSKSWIFNGTKGVSLTNSSSVTVYGTPTISVIDPTPLSFDDLRAYGDDLNIHAHTLANNTTRVYGVEIDVEYDLPKNKVVYFGQTLIDLTADTVTAERLTKGFTAHDASGALITGVATEGSTYQDEDDCVVLGEDESSAPQGNLSITANGTYDVAQYAGASVEVPVGMSETDLRNYISRSTNFTDIEWPEGLTRIGPGAFMKCSYFNPASLPSGLTTINEYAFDNCTKLALTSLPDSITVIGDYAFHYCTRLALTGLPSGLISIGFQTFRDCQSLALTSLPSGIKTIRSYAFANCYGLALSSLPSSVTYIDTYAFSCCDGITSISCEGAITTLGTQAFGGNSSHLMQLTSASFPNMALAPNIGPVFGYSTAAYACQQLAFCDIGSTTGIGANAFANCYALETLVLRKTASVCTLGSVNAFLNTPMRGYNDLTGKVYVPSALIESYKTANNWKTLYDAGTVEFVAIEGSEYER